MEEPLIGLAKAGIKSVFTANKYSDEILDEFSTGFCLSGI